MKVKSKKLSHIHWEDFDFGGIILGRERNVTIEKKKNKIKEDEMKGGSQKENTKTRRG